MVIVNSGAPTNACVITAPVFTNWEEVEITRPCCAILCKAPNAVIAFMMHGEDVVVFDMLENKVTVHFVGKRFKAEFHFQPAATDKSLVVLTTKNSVACFVTDDVILIVDIQKCALECHKPDSSKADVGHLSTRVKSPRPSNRSYLGQHLYIAETRSDRRPVILHVTHFQAVVDVRQFCNIRVISLICFIDICKYYWLPTKATSCQLHVYILSVHACLCWRAIEKKF